MRTRPALLLAALAALLTPAGASASVGCTVAGDAVEVTTSDFAEGVALVREGDAIAVSDDRTGQPVSCAGGPPAIGAVARFGVTAAAEETSVYIDRAGGELTGIAFELAGPSMSLGVGGTDGEDLAVFSTRNGATVGSLTAGGEEIVAADLANVLARGDRGGDTLSAVAANGGPRGALRRLRVSATFDGGGGADTLIGGAQPDVLIGGSGRDLLRGGPGPDEIDCGGGRDVVADARKNDNVRSCERSVS